MEQVTLYSESHDLQRTDACYVLENYFRFVKWDAEVRSKILDVGCGDGDVTLHLLVPRVPRNFAQLVATDVSAEMLSFAKAKSKDSRVSFQKLDIAAKNIPVDYQQQYHHVFSFYCLHWVQNHRQALKNIYKILIPGGDMLLTFLANSPIFTIYENLAKLNKWTNYMQKVLDFITPFQHSNNPKDEYEKIIAETGYKSIFCRVEDREFTYSSVKTLQKSVLAVSPFISQLTRMEIENYWQDFMNEVRKNKSVKIEKSTNNNEERVRVIYKIFVVYAVKPL